MKSGMCLLYCLNNKNITVLEYKCITKFMARNVDTQKIILVVSHLLAGVGFKTKIK